MKKATSILAVIIAIMLIAVLLLFAYRYTNGFTGSPQWFYVQCGKQRLFDQSTNNKFSKILTLKVHSLNLLIEPFAYDIVPYNDFTYQIDGATYHFADIDSFRGCFGETATKNTLAIDFRGLSISEVIARAHDVDVKAVTLDELPRGDLFKLVISSGDNSVCICFRIGSNVTNIELDPTEVIL